MSASSNSTIEKPMDTSITYNATYGQEPQPFLLGETRLIVGKRKIGRMEDGMGEKFPSTHTSSHKET